MPQIITGIVSALGEGVSQVAEVGANLVRGLWQGIQSLAGWLWDKVSGWISSIWDGITDFFGIHSPSTKMEWVSEMNVEGAVVGIEKNKSKAVKAYGAMGEEMLAEVDSGLAAVNDKLKSSIGEIETGFSAKATVEAVSASVPADLTGRGGGVTTSGGGDTNVGNIFHVVSMGFIFDNKHSGDMGVVFKSTDRTLLPAKRVTQYTIPGKSGTYDIEDGYENREIVCTVAFVGEGYHYAGVRTRARAVAEWLSGEGLLVFDDEPEKAYSAKVVGGISIEQIAVTGTCEVRFLCKPFAESLRYNQQDVKSVSLPHTEAVNVRGTQETDGLIYITARGNIQTLTITRLKVNKKLGGFYYERII